MKMSLSALMSMEKRSYASTIVLPSMKRLWGLAEAILISLNPCDHGCDASRSTQRYGGKSDVPSLDPVSPLY